MDSITDLIHGLRELSQELQPEIAVVREKHLRPRIAGLDTRSACIALESSFREQGHNVLGIPDEMIDGALASLPAEHDEQRLESLLNLVSLFVLLHANGLIHILTGGES